MTQTLIKVPKGAHNMNSHHLVVFGGKFCEKMGLEGQNSFITSKSQIAQICIFCPKKGIFDLQCLFKLSLSVF